MGYILTIMQAYGDYIWEYVIHSGIYLAIVIINNENIIFDEPTVTLQITRAF